MVKDDADILEGLVDKHGLPGVLDALATIAAEKAEHLATNWHDASGAKMWDRDACLLAKLAEQID